MRTGVIRWVACAVVGFSTIGAFAVVEEAPSVREAGDEDYAARLELVRVGTGERFDFSAPDGAEVE